MGSYRAKERGYIRGELKEPGEIFSAENFTGKWAEPLNKTEAKVARASEEALSQQPDDVEIQNLAPEALQAMCAERGIDPKGLNKKQMVNAIKAARDR